MINSVHNANLITGNIHFGWIRSVEDRMEVFIHLVEKGF